MAKQRFINTKFWDDSYIHNLPPYEKLVFLYFLTNPLTEICGAYEISVSRIEFDLGIKAKILNPIIKKFDKESKIFFREGWVFIPNFIKHQIGRGNPKVELGIERSLKLAPKWIQDIAYDRVSIPLGASPHSDLDSDSDTDLDSDSQREVAKAPTPAEIAKNFFNSELKQQEVIGWLTEKGIPTQVAATEVASFISYWTELTKSGLKQKWELQPTFELRRRFGTWFKNYKEFNKKSQGQKGHLSL